MSMPVLIEVYDEMRRLAIAGSAVAPGDFRLKKLVAPLQKSGEKSPVFGKVAQAVTAVVDSNDKTAAAALLELTTLVNAILYTQGETGIAGELKPLETTNLGPQSTQAGARVLKPLLEALSSTGSGRLELVRDAFDRGTFNDLRLVKPALGALDDPYPEIGDFIAEKVLPLYGKAIAPELRAKLDIKAKTGGQINRLRLLHKIDAQGSRDLVKAALEDGSKEMKVAAVECLGTADDDLGYLLEQSTAKSREVRAAALRAMIATGVTRTDVVAAMKKAIDGPDLELIVARVRQSTLAEIQKYVLGSAGKQLDDLLASKDPKEQGPNVRRLQQLALCLQGRTDPPAEAFLLNCFEKRTKLAAIKAEPSGTDFNELLAHLLAQGTPAMRQALIDAQPTLTGNMLAAAVWAARATLDPADFHKVFSPMLKSGVEKRTKKNAAEVDRGAAVLAVVSSDNDRVSSLYWNNAVTMARGFSQKSLRELDRRWLATAIDAVAVDLVCKLAQPGDTAAGDFLAAQLNEKKEPHEEHTLLRTLVRLGHPTAVDAIVNGLKKQAKGTRFVYMSYWYGRIIADLPKSALPRIEELLPTLPEKMADQLMDSLAVLRTKPD